MFRLAAAFILLVSALGARAASLHLEVLDVEIGFKDYDGQPTLCLTRAVEVGTGRSIGLVEDITDCYWARQARASQGVLLYIPAKDFSPLVDDAMSSHLQAFDSQLEFLWSTAD